MSDKNYNTIDGEIDFKDLILAIWNKKFTIAIITSIFAVFSVFYALSVPNIYQSNALLAPNTNNLDGLSSKLGGYSSLAGIAGISLPSESSSETIEAIERIKSYDFFVNNFIPNIKYENLVAAKRWNKLTNSIEYNKKIFKKENNEWVKNKKNQGTLKPSMQEAYSVYSDVLKVSQDKKTSFVSISIQHPSPFISEKWLNLVIKNINNQMRELDKTIAENALNYLNSAVDNTAISEIKDVIFDIIENQLQTLMLIEATDDYIFKIIASPIAPEKKFGPSRALVCITITILGFLLSIAITLLLPFLANIKIQKSLLKLE